MVVQKGIFDVHSLADFGRFNRFVWTRSMVACVGNKYMLLAMVFPIGIDEPIAMLQECKRRCDRMKIS